MHIGIRLEIPKRIYEDYPINEDNPNNMILELNDLLKYEILPNVISNMYYYKLRDNLLNCNLEEVLENLSNELYEYTRLNKDIIYEDIEKIINKVLTIYVSNNLLTQSELNNLIKVFYDYVKGD